MNSPGRILIFRQSSLGDVILALPVAQRLRDSYPDAVIEFCTKRAYAPLIQHTPAIDRVHAFENDSEFRALIRELRHSKFDLLIDLQVNFRSALLRLALFPARALRYRKRRLAREMVVRRAHLKLSVDHTIQAYMKTLRRLGLDISPMPPVMTVPSAARDFAESFLGDSGLSGLRPLVALCPGAMHYEKKWPWQMYAEVAQQLLEDQGTGVTVISAVGDNVPERLNIENSRLVAVKDWDIINVAAILARCRAAISNDSGLMHLANAVGVPVVAIFGPTNPRLGFGPALPGSKMICDDVICSPCSVHGQKPCFQPEKYCFKEVTPARVYRELKSPLEAVPPA